MPPVWRSTRKTPNLPSPAQVDEMVVGPAVQLMGPTRLGEWLMVDARVARAVPSDSPVFKACQALSERGSCGVIEGTVVIDLLDAGREARELLLNPNNWPKPGGLDGA